MGIFDAMFKDLKDPVDPEIIEAYKYAFRDKGTSTFFPENLNTGVKSATNCIDAIYKA
jgi:hypothetical protein